MDFFVPVLEKYTVSLLTKIAEEYNLPTEELVSKYSSYTPVKVRREPAPPSVPCPGLTGKGTPCKNKCIAGSVGCRLHSGEPRAVRVPKVPRVPKVLVRVPEHSHGIDEVDPLCALCSTHGNAIDPGLPSVAFECLDPEAEVVVPVSVIDYDALLADEPEPESPGGLRHRERLEAMGIDYSTYYDDEDEDESDGFLEEEDLM
jgi:hypothetical protein